ncbi:hypothetical protein MVUOKPPV_CDS0016 [Klebsiella phage phi1_175008]|uniref:Uncharacterized protein n=2 Tax=Klebsiella phage phi1_175008 TaxID=3127744 RepID=A0AC61ZTU5_9CAUD
MNVKKKSKIKSLGRYKHYKSFGWLARVAYRLRGDKTIRHYLATGKYVRTESAEAYELVPGSGMLFKDLFISSKVRRSRVKNIPDGARYVGKING